MKSSLAIKTLAVASLFLLGEHAFADDALKSLQGDWVGVEQGNENASKVTLEIKGGKLRFDGQQGEWYSGTIEVVKQEKNSKLFAKIKDCSVPEMIGKISNGIYQLEKDVLTIAARIPGDPQEPTGFDDEKCRTFVLKKRN